MEAVVARRAEPRLDTLRRMVRRGGRSGIVKLLGKVRPEDVALSMRGLMPGERLHLFRILFEEYPDAAGDVLTELDTPQRAEILERLSADEIAAVLEQMEVDDAVFIVESLPPELEERVLEVVDLSKKLDEVQTHLTYRDDSAGRIMTSEFFSLSAAATVSEATAALRRVAHADVEMIFYLYVVDEAGRLLGVASLRQLLLSPPDQKLGEIVQRDVIKVHTDTDQEEVAQLAARYDLLAIPVVDDEGRLVGIVTVDDIVDILKEEATEDFYKMAGTTEDELLYQDRTLRLAGVRLPWLLVNMVGLLLSGLLLKNFQVTFKEALFLLTFVPVVMGMAGNSGTQVSTITVRGLATGRIGLGGRIRSFLWQQVKVGIIVGVVIGLVVAAAALALESNVVYSFVVGSSLFTAILLASINGAVIPLIFDKVGIDPAVAAGPLVTTSNDITGILIYFGMAALLIESLLR